MNTKCYHQRITGEIDVAIAIRPIIKVLVPDRVDRAPVMCHKIHRVVRTPWI